MMAGKFFDKRIDKVRNMGFEQVAKVRAVFIWGIPFCSSSKKVDLVKPKSMNAGLSENIKLGNKSETASADFWEGKRHVGTERTDLDDEKKSKVHEWGSVLTC